MKAHQLPEGLSDSWLTPPSILEALGEFDLDPCAMENQPWRTALNHYSLPQDGLSLPWKGRVWLNPPFNRRVRAKWMDRMAAHNHGIMLIPAATETVAFQNCVWGKAAAVCFLRNRPHFHFPDGKRAPFNCGTAIALVAYGAQDRGRLFTADLGKTFSL